jgi:23S rRNA pseudouridine2605 synthase
MKRRAEAKPPQKTRPAPPADERGERLQKVLAAAGIGSRRECEELIREGRVEVDRQVATELGTRVFRDRQEIRVDGEALHRPKRVYFAVNKPPGIVSTNSDPAGRARVVDLVDSGERLFTVGRLDKSSQGLIIVTNDGELANRLTHPRYGVEKTYAVRVAGHPTPAQLNMLRQGIHLAEGLVRVVSLHVKAKQKDTLDLEIVLNEGRNREIRRILARIGHRVLTLKRTSIGTLRLGKLPGGASRRLTTAEVRSLEKCIRPQRGTPPTRAKATARKKHVAPKKDYAVSKKKGPPSKRKKAAAKKGHSVAGKKYPAPKKQRSAGGRGGAPAGGKSGAPKKRAASSRRKDKGRR